MDQLQIGVIGLGFGQFLVRTLAHLDEARLVAVADRADNLPGGIDAYAARYGAKAYRESSEMLQSEDLDAVIIATSPRYRPDIVRDVARRGLPMFVEKPWASNLEQAHALAEICQQYRAQVMIGFSFRFLPAITRLRELMDNELGVGWMLNGEYCFDWLPPSDHWLWQPDNGNGFLNENSGHLFDAVCYLMGKPVSVMAESVNFRGSPSAEGAAITLRFENGSAASLTVGGFGAGAIRAYPRINIFTAGGQAHLQGQGHIWDSLTWATRDSTSTHTYSEAPEALGNTRYRYAIQHFIECVREGKPPAAGIKDGIQAVALAEAVYKSARTGLKVDIRL